MIPAGLDEIGAALVSWLLFEFLRACDQDLREPQGRVIPGRVVARRAA